MRLLIDDAKVPDRSLLHIPGRAHCFLTMTMHGNGASIATLAKNANIEPPFLTRSLKPSFLAPTILATILDGRQPVQFTAQQIKRKAGQLTSDRSNQKMQLGIG